MERSHNPGLTQALRGDGAQNAAPRDWAGGMVQSSYCLQLIPFPRLNQDWVISWFSGNCFSFWGAVIPCCKSCHAQRVWGVPCCSAGIFVPSNCHWFVFCNWTVWLPAQLHSKAEQLDRSMWIRSHKTDFGAEGENLNSSKCTLAQLLFEWGHKTRFTRFPAHIVGPALQLLPWLQECLGMV